MPHQAMIPAIGAAVGGYLLLSACGLLARGSADAFAEGLRANAAGRHAVAGLAFFIGIAVVAVAAPFRTPVAAGLGLVGGWWLLEGAVLLAFDARAVRPDAAVHLRRMNLIALPAGAALLAASLLDLAKVLP